MRCAMPCRSASRHGGDLVERLGEGRSCQHHIAEVACGRDGGVARRGIEERQLTEVVARRETCDLLAAAAHDRGAVGDDEEAFAAFSLADDFVPVADRDGLAELRDQIELIGCAGTEHRNPREIHLVERVVIAGHRADRKAQPDLRRVPVGTAIRCGSMRTWSWRTRRSGTTQTGG